MHPSASLTETVNENNAHVVASTTNHIGPKLVAVALRDVAERLKQLNAFGRSPEEVKDECLRVVEGFAGDMEARETNEG